MATFLAVLCCGAVWFQEAAKPQYLVSVKVLAASPLVSHRTKTSGLRIVKGLGDATVDYLNADGLHILDRSSFERYNWTSAAGLVAVPPIAGREAHKCRACHDVVPESAQRYLDAEVVWWLEPKAGGKYQLRNCDFETGQVITSVEDIQVSEPSAFTVRLDSETKVLAVAHATAVTVFDIRESVGFLGAVRQRTLERREELQLQQVSALLLDPVGRLYTAHGNKVTIMDSEDEVQLVQVTVPEDVQQLLLGGDSEEKLYMVGKQCVFKLDLHCSKCKALDEM